jgi:hypothetical protein
MMTAGGLPASQPDGGIVPFGRTEAGTFGVQDLLAEF